MKKSEVGTSLIGTHRSLKFLIKMSQDNSGPKCQKRTLHLANGQEVLIDAYPANKNPEEAPTIMFIHGINKGGHGEPRIINLCRSISQCGFNVVAPHYPEVANYWIDPDTTENIAQTIDAICADPSLAPTGDLGVFSISFTGTLSLHAASKCSNPNNVRNVLLMGSFSRAKSTILYILSKECRQNYPKLILVRNLMRLSGKADPVILDGIYHAINDVFENDEQHSELYSYLSSIPSKKRQEILDIVNNIMDSEHYMEKYAAEIDQFADLFDKSEDFSKLGCPIIIVHGEDDNTIAYKESIALHEQLKQKNIVNKLLVTNLIENHSHYKISLNTIKDFIKLSTTIGSFFGDSKK